MNVCKPVVIFARFDSYYVNWTYSKIWHWAVKLICDLNWFGPKMIWIWFDYLWFDLWFAHHWDVRNQNVRILHRSQSTSTMIIAGSTESDWLKLSKPKFCYRNTRQLSSNLTQSIGLDPTHCARKNLDPTRPDRTYPHRSNPWMDPTHVQLCSHFFPFFIPYLSFPFY